MQENWDTIDPKLLHLDPNVVCDQDSAQYARANSTLQASDFPHVDEEAVDALAYDRRDSDSLAIIGPFEFEYVQLLWGLLCQSTSLTVPSTGLFKIRTVSGPKNKHYPTRYIVQETPIIRSTQVTMALHIWGSTSPGAIFV
jgi:hypothetical protein